MPHKSLRPATFATLLLAGSVGFTFAQSGGSSGGGASGSAGTSGAAGAGAASAPGSGTGANSATPPAGTAQPNPAPPGTTGSGGLNARTGCSGQSTTGMANSADGLGRTPRIADDPTVGTGQTGRSTRNSAGSGC